MFRPALATHCLEYKRLLSSPGSLLSSDISQRQCLSQGAIPGPKNVMSPFLSHSLNICTSLPCSTFLSCTWVITCDCLSVCHRRASTSGGWKPRLSSPPTTKAWHTAGQWGPFLCQQTTVICVNYLLFEFSWTMTNLRWITGPLMACNDLELRRWACDRRNKSLASLPKYLSIDSKDNKKDLLDPMNSDAEKTAWDHSVDKMKFFLLRWARGCWSEFNTKSEAN